MATGVQAQAPPIPDADHLWDLETLAGAQRLGDWMFEQFAPYVGPEAIEVGAGIGTYSSRLLEAGVEHLLAVEPEPACTRRLRERFGKDARVTVSADELPGSADVAAWEGRADLVVCQNVLEHIRDDRAAVAEMAGSLRPGGHLSLLVPAHPRLYGPLDAAYGHHRRYTRARLRALVRDTGLEEVALYSFNLLGVPGWWVSSRRGSESISPASIRAYEALLAAWRPVERRLRPPWGLSLVVHARRR
jgi:SAM-dependent methyltransferase